MGLVCADLPQSLKKDRLPKFWLEQETFVERGCNCEKKGLLLKTHFSFITFLFTMQKTLPRKQV